jgi:two-component system CheB/CheR fusion protein
MDAPPVVVAVASSAGDLEAICELLSAVPPECAAAFVIVQQLDAGREKLLLETLSQRTTLPVMGARDGVVAAPRHVYMITANTTLTMTGDRLRGAPEAGGLQHPGDALFASLAKERGESAIGVVLSGPGSDGALGVRAIGQCGGATFAQYPGSARFPSMPINAIDTGCVRSVLRPNEIARELARLSGYASVASLVDDRETRPRPGEPALEVPGSLGRQRMRQAAIRRTAILPPV